MAQLLGRGYLGVEHSRIRPLILHLLFEDKFGEYAVKQFSGEEMCSEFVVVSFRKEGPSALSSDIVKTIRYPSVEFKEMLDCLGNYHAIVLHGLFHRWQEKVLCAVPPEVKVAWVFWGGDIYGRSDFSAGYLSVSSKLLLCLQRGSRVLSRKKVKPSYEIPFSLLQRIHFCLTDIHEDYVFVKQYLKTDIQEVWYNYYSIEETLGDLADERVMGHNVLVGNSSSIDNNHLYGFRLIRRLRKGDSKVVVPLSYGEAWLKNKILMMGRIFFGRHFMPLVDFIPRPEYNQIIRSCSAVVMPHYRPQAFGNILTALWLGSRVFLSEKNVLFAYFRRIGAVVFSIEHDLKKSNPQVLSPLPENDVLQNRKAIKAIYGKDVMHQKNLELVKTLNG